MFPIYPLGISYLPFHKYCSPLSPSPLPLCSTAHALPHHARFLLEPLGNSVIILFFCPFLCLTCQLQCRLLQAGGLISCFPSAAPVTLPATQADTSYVSTEGRKTKALADITHPWSSCMSVENQLAMQL